MGIHVDDVGCREPGLLESKLDCPCGPPTLRVRLGDVMAVRCEPRPRIDPVDLGATGGGEFSGF